MYDELVAKVNNIDVSEFILSIKQINLNYKRKFLTSVDLLKKKTDYNAKIIDIKNKIPSISGLAALTPVENKISDVSSLVKKTDYDTKISEIEKKHTDHDHDKYITTSEFNKQKILLQE